MLSYVSEDQIQAMALIVLCLRNNLDTNSAWVTMGTYRLRGRLRGITGLRLTLVSLVSSSSLLASTIRLAQSIGLHEASNPRWALNPATDHFRLHLWWLLVWQDTFLSITYDRPPSCIYASRCPLPQHPGTAGASRPLADSLSRACQTILDRIVYKDYVAPHTTDRRSNHDVFLQFKNRFALILKEAAPLDADNERCITQQGRLEHLVLQIHVGYCICRLYHELLVEEQDPTDNFCPARETLQFEYTSEVVKVMEDFFQLVQLSPLICRSWPVVHNAVSPVISARNLLTSSQTVTPSQGQCLLQLDPLIHRLMGVLEKIEQKSHWLDEDGNVRVLGPHARLLQALKDLYGDPRQ